MTARDAADVTLIDLGPPTWKNLRTMYEATAPHTQPQTPDSSLSSRGRPSRCSQTPPAPTAGGLFRAPVRLPPDPTQKPTHPHPMEGEMDQVLIFDTTLRDGEQSPGISLDVVEKLEIAEQLARLGVDVIEAGFPIASDGDFESVEAIAKAVRGPIITGLSRTGLHRHRSRVGGGTPRGSPPHPHLHRDLRDPHGEEAADDARPGEGGDGRECRPGQGLLRRHRVLARGRIAFRSRLHVRSPADRGRQRRHDAEHPRHGRLRRPRGVREAHPLRHRLRPRRLHRVDALSRRPGARGRQLAGRSRQRVRARSSAR